MSAVLTERLVAIALAARQAGHGGKGAIYDAACRELVFEECTFRNNGGCGVQLGGRDVDRIALVRSAVVDNAAAAFTRPPANALAGPGDRTAACRRRRSVGELPGNGRRHRHQLLLEDRRVFQAGIHHRPGH